MDEEIKAMLARYLRDEISLREFSRWFVPTTWSVDQTDNIGARVFAAEIDLRLAEYSHGHWSEHELRRHLRSLLENETLEVVIGIRLPLKALLSTSFRRFELSCTLS